MKRCIVLAALMSLAAAAGCSGCDENNAAAPNPAPTSTNTEAVRAAPPADGGTPLYVRPDPRRLKLDPRWLNPPAADGGTQQAP